MAILKNLTFAAMPAEVAVNPTMAKRKQLVVRMEHQKQLLKNPKYKRTTTNRKGEEKSHRVNQMWRESPDGVCYFSIRGIEFAPGKPAIKVQSRAELPSIIDQLIEAVEAGELDDKLAMPRRRGGGGRRKKAA